MKAVGIFIILAILTAAGLVRWGLSAQYSNAEDSWGEPVKTISTTRPVEDGQPTPTPAATATATPKTTALPASAKLDLPFTSQAPFGVWDPLHEDACEEASFLMVKYFMEGKTFTKEQIDKDIIDLVHWEEERGYGLSITLTELNTIIKGRYNISNGEVVKNITIDDIKREIAEGRPVIVGAAGKILDNPNFTDGGPVYHMLVITGYDERGFITNDPGTRLGKDFRYTYDNMDDALHDWDPQNIQNGGRNMLVFR